MDGNAENEHRHIGLGLSPYQIYQSILANEGLGPLGWDPLSRPLDDLLLERVKQPTIDYRPQKNEGLQVCKFGISCEFF